jgi:hypothetical protein
LEVTSADRWNPLSPFTDVDGVRHAWDHEVADWCHPYDSHVTCREPTCAGNRRALERLGATVTSVTETRVVEARVDTTRVYLVPARSGRGELLHLVVHRVRALYRRPTRSSPSGTPSWIPTQVIVIGRESIALTRHMRGDGPLPDERQRTFVNLDEAPSWVAVLARALGRVTGEREL